MRDYDDLLMVRYSVLALCTQRTNDGRGSRQLNSFSSAMGFRDPNLLRAAVIGERPKTLQSSRADPHRRPGRRLCQLLALFGSAACSGQLPLSGEKRTSSISCSANNARYAFSLNDNYGMSSPRSEGDLARMAAVCPKQMCYVLCPLGHPFPRNQRSDPPRRLSQPVRLGHKQDVIATVPFIPRIKCLRAAIHY